MQPIAITGIGCRFPGKVNSPETFWNLLYNGTDAITEVPAHRLDLQALYDAQPKTSGKIITRQGGYLDDLDQFDPYFFGISPREAQYLDPQQRLLIEMTWEALEDAGLLPAQLAGSRTGVFVGVWTSDFEEKLFRASPEINLYMTTGSGRYSASGRLSYHFDFQGPSMTLDTACSSSLVAIHLACESIARGECIYAIAGGVNVILQPHITIGYSQGGILSPDGRCKFGDASANGYVRSEGGGVIVLKSLDQAIADGDPIYAVIRGSAVNNDGHRSNHLVTPSVTGQVDVLRQAYANAGIAPSLVQYVEAHGTGTQVGDTVELQALGMVLGEHRPLDQPCWAGSVKTNIGHTEAAAGMAGLIKVVLSLKHRCIPPSLHCHTPNPAIPWQELPIQLVQQPTPWPQQGRAIAGLNSFGITGTNAHIVLEAAPVRMRQTPAAHAAYLLPLSAQTPQALQQKVQSYATFLNDGEQTVSLHDLCYTASVHRTHFAHRQSFIATSKADLLEQLQQAHENSDAISQPQEPRVVFVFPGQGSQWPGMGRQLLKSQPVFRAALEHCEQAMHPYIDWSLIEQLLADETTSRLNEIDVIQPLLFAFEVALATLWRSWQIEPAAIIGHSMGEVAAAHIAGALSLDDAASIICQRSHLLKQLSGQGAMALIELPRQEAEHILTGYEDRIAIAIINSSRSTVFSGDPAALDAILERAQQQHIFYRRIKVDVASHSPQMDSLRQPLLELIQAIAPQTTGIPFYSTVTGQQQAGPTLDATYWTKNLRNPVLFASTIQQLIKDGYTTFLEMSPHPILLPPLQEGLSDAGVFGLALASLHREQDEEPQLLLSLGTLYQAGQSIQWSALYPEGGTTSTLPLNPWQKERFWPDNISLAMGTIPASTHTFWKQATGRNPLLQEKAALAGQKQPYLWQTTLSTTTHAFLADHKVLDKSVLPATAYIEMMLAAAAELLGPQQPAVPTAHYTIEHMRLKHMLDLRPEPVVLQLLMQPDDQMQHFTCQIFSRSAGQDNEAWVLHAEGRVRATQKVDTLFSAVDITAQQWELAETRTAETHYELMRQRGLPYGPAFQGVQRIKRRSYESLAVIAIPPQSNQTYQAHPAVLDAALQVVLDALPIETQHDTYVPVSFTRLISYEALPVSLWAYTRLQPPDGPEQSLFTADVTLVSHDEQVLMEIQGLQLQRLPSSSSASRPTQDAQALQRWLYEIQWHATALPACPTNQQLIGNYLIFADTTDLGTYLHTELERQGSTHSILVSSGDQYQRHNEWHYTLQPEQLADYKHLLKDIARPYSGIIYLWGLTDAERGVAPPLESALDSCGNLLFLVQALTQTGWRDAPRLWIITNGAQLVPTHATPINLAAAPLWGMARVIAYEHTELRCTIVDVSASDSMDERMALLQELYRGDRENQIALRGAQRYVARLQHWSPSIQSAQTATSSTQHPIPMMQQLELGTVGIIDTLHMQAQDISIPGPGEVQIKVKATGLNFSDVMKMTGIYPNPTGERQPLGLECAGTIVMVGAGVESYKVGDDVLAIAFDSFGTFVNTSEWLVALKPGSLTFTEAAGIPIAFLTAYYALHHLARLTAGERVLIHAATGGVGLAAIQIARTLGAEIFATAGSAEKRDYLKALGIQHVMDSRSLSFVDEIKALTDGTGVDVILNSLSGDAIAGNLSLLAPYGRFLELGKTDIYQGHQLGLWDFQRNLSYYAIDLADAFASRPQWCGTLFQQLMLHFETGAYKPIPHQLFEIDHVIDACRLMAQANHIGKLVVTYPRTELLDASQPQRISIVDDVTYLITGGLGGLGLLFSQWLVQQGARHLILLGRSTPDAEARHAISALEQLGVQVQIRQVDVSDYAELAAVLQDARAHMPPVRGILHLAGVLEDSTLQQQTRQHFQHVLRPKIAGAWNLHQLSIRQPLDFFVLFSSASAVLGFAGQSNYAAANTFLDVLAHYRQQQGLVGQSINWGPWSDVGLAAAQSNRGERLAFRGVASIPPQQGIALFEYLLERNLPQIAAMAFNVRQWDQFYPKAAQMPFLHNLHQDQDRSTLLDIGNDIQQQLQQAAPERKRQLLEEHVRTQISQVLRLPLSRIARQTAIDKLGFDSLMAVEFRNRLETSLGITLKTTLIWIYPTLPALIDHLAERMGLSFQNEEKIQQEEQQSETQGPQQELFASLEQLSDDELANLLARELSRLD